MKRNLSHEDRVKIQMMLDNNIKIDEIAEYVGFHRSSIYRELNRFPGKSYNHIKAHQHMKSSMTRPNTRVPTPKMIVVIESKLINEQWRPEQISHWMKKHDQGSVSHVWIYQYIHRDTLSGGELHNHLRHGHYDKTPKQYRGKIKDRVPLNNVQRL